MPLSPELCFTSAASAKHNQSDDNSARVTQMRVAEAADQLPLMLNASYADAPSGEAKLPQTIA